MPPTNQNDIEHPIQPWWHQGYSEPVAEAHRADLENRFNSTGFDIELVISSLTNVTSFNHMHRQSHESNNLQHLGLHLPSQRRYMEEEARNSNDQKNYENLAGRQQTIGEFIQWFSYVSHRAFVAQEQHESNKKFERISLELGGKRQFGDWEATSSLDSMVRSVPQQLLTVEPSTRIQVYGAPAKEALTHPNIQYAPDAPKSYTLLPRYEANLDRTHTLRTAMVRRRRPVADIYIQGQSDVVLFKESIGLLVIDLLEPDLRAQLLKDCELSLASARNAKTKMMKFQGTDAANIGGEVFEKAIHAPEGTSTDIVPVSAHYVQGVGERYAQFRNK